MKEQEKEKVKQELRRELEHQIVPKVIKAEHFTQRLQAVETYTSWLEYELLNIVISQMINESKETVEGASKENNIKILSTAEKIFTRLNSILNNIEFRQKDLEKLRQAEHAVLKSKIRSLKLDGISEDRLLSKFRLAIEEQEIDEFTPEYARERMEEIFQIEMNLLITKLAELGENELSNTFANYLKRDRPRRLSERRKKAEDESSQNPVTIE